MTLVTAIRSPHRPAPRIRRALTLIEMILSLLVLTLVSTAVITLVFGADNTNRYTGNQGAGLWDSDMAWHRIAGNAQAALPSANSGMTPTVSTDSNGQSRLTFIVPDIANSTTRTLVYYCTGSSAPFTLVESDPRYNVAGAPNPIARNVSSFSVTLDSSTTMKIWTTLVIAPPGGWSITRHFCTQCRNF